MTSIEALSREEQLFVRDHLREVGQVVGFVAAVHVVSVAVGYVLGRALGTAISLAHNALQRRHP